MANPAELQIYVTAVLLSPNYSVSASLLDQMVRQVSMQKHLSQVLAFLAHSAKAHFDQVNRCLDYIFCALNMERDRLLLEMVFIAKFFVNATLSSNSITHSVVAGLRSFLNLADARIGHRLYGDTGSYCCHASAKELQLRS